MGSHSVTYHPTQVNTPRLNPSQTGRYSIYLPRRDGRLSWPEHHECKQLAEGYYLKAVLVGLEPATSESLVRDLTTMPPSHFVA